MSRGIARQESDSAAGDAVIAVKSAFMLGASLVATWSVALVVRLFLPRHLGPELFGVFNFADTFAATFFVVLGLGVETYIRREIPVRPGHASDFFFGFVLLRLLMSVAVFAAMAVVMTLAGRPPAVQRIVFIFGAAQVLVTLNGNLAALLHATRAVSGLAVVNVVTKVLWGAGVALAIVLAPGLAALAFVFFASELARLVALFVLARRQLGVEMRVDLTAIKLVIVASLPFYLNSVANTVYAKVDVSMLAVLANDTEVGWYGASSNLSSLALLVAPLIGWVLLPLLSRAAARSTEELYATLRRAILTILPLVMPISLLMGVGADVWVSGLFGHSFVPATLSLRLLAPVFILTYLAMMTATCLLLVDRAWTVTLISALGLVLNPALNLKLVPWAMHALGPGGAGAGAATALLITEICVTTAMMVALGRVVFDRATLSSLGKAAIGYVAMIALDRALAPLGAARLALVLPTYVAFLFAVGTVKVTEIREMAHFVLQQRQSHART